MTYIKKFFQKYKWIILGFIVWRLVLFLVELGGFNLLPFKASFPYVGPRLIASGLPQWLWQWGNFDGVHYLGIAKNGYRDLGVQAFFPIYPLAISFIRLFIANRLLSGLIVSNLAALVAGILFHRLVARDFNKQTANWAVAFWFLFPASFSLVAVYPGSLYMMFLMLAFLETGWLSGISSFLAAGTRIFGMFIVASIPFEQPKPWWRTLSLAGIGAYMAYLFAMFGNPLLFLSSQAAFANARATSLTTLVTPFQVALRYLKIFLSVPLTHYDFWVAAVEFCAFLFGVAVLGWLTVKRKVRFSYLAYAWPTLLLPSLTGTFSSMPRYLLSVFPIFIGLALIKSKVLKLVLLAMFTVLLLIFTVLFTRGYWVT